VNLLSLYEKLEKLVGRLPESLQSPILREIRPLQALFLHQRAPRLLLLGDREVSRSELINALLQIPAAESAQDHLQDGAWQLYTHPRGKVRVLDARRPGSLALLRRSLGAQAPDVCLYLHGALRPPEDRAADLEHARQVIGLANDPDRELKLEVIGAAFGSVDSAGDLRHQLDEAVHTVGCELFGGRIGGLAVLGESPSEAGRLASAIAATLPPEAKLEWVRLAGLREEQHELARVVIKSVTAICAAIGAQPIPLADFPILTSLQAAMVAGIMHISGREMKMRLAAEWLAALGANIGVGLALREGARAVLKFVPVWGDFVSGGIAAAGTYAIGRAAVGYFIDGVSLQNAKALFHKSDRDRKLIANS
jgi:uncharacterized protein (DUF697 family)